MAEQEDFIGENHHRRNILPIIKDAATGWYKGWYFDLRFREECDRSLRHNLPMSVICLRLRSTDDAAAVTSTLVSSAHGLLRSTDMASQLNDKDFVFCLPHTDDGGAAIVMERLVSILSEYQPTIGRATF